MAGCEDGWGRPCRPKFPSHSPRHAATPHHPWRKGPLKCKQASELPPKRKPARAFEPGTSLVTQPVTEKNSFPHEITEDIAPSILRSVKALRAFPILK
jgi:hypothetical protein